MRLKCKLIFGVHAYLPPDRVRGQISILKIPQEPAAYIVKRTGEKVYE